LFYVAHRLFAAHDRAVGAYVASRLASATGLENVFLPFCDTDEENLVADCKGLRLFELDRARLLRISGMIAVLHGPSLDDGVCMEIGFAVASGVPVVLFSTDFQTYTPTVGGPVMAFPDPLLEQVAVAVARAYQIGSPGPDTEVDRFRAFLKQNLGPVSAATTKAVAALMTAARQEPHVRPRDPARVPLAYIEPSPYFPDDMWTGISTALRARGWQVHEAQRFQTGVGTAEAAQADWAAATTASLAVVDVRGPEAPPGAALVIGACAAAGVPVLAAHPGTWLTLANGREPNWRNLMIQYAVRGRFTSVSQFTAALEGLP
jgi:Nucleoside 2-deoxyribosyltransferase